MPEAGLSENTSLPHSVSKLYVTSAFSFLSASVAVTFPTWAIIDNDDDEEGDTSPPRVIDNDCKPVGLAPLYKAAAYLGALCCRFVHVKREAAFRELRDVVVGINHLYKITCQLINIH